jgi:septum formation protein
MGETHIQLASASPRRRELLERAGVPVRVVRSGLDDGVLRAGSVDPVAWTMALAYLKARAGLEGQGGSGVVLGADTMVVKDSVMIGQPKDAADARRILGILSDGQHTVVTGVAMVWRAEGELQRMVFADVATVRVGVLEPSAVDAYIASGEWRGKAGAYNLMERVEAGWPIEWDGDPGTIMGLPMERLGPVLRDRLHRGMSADA